MDDRPFGGGEGMVFKPEPIFRAVETVRKSDDAEVVVLSAAGRRFDQAEALRLSKAEQVILVCGRYEGIDERVTEHLATAEISIGDFILSGGEIAAAMVVDAVTRYVPGVVGKGRIDIAGFVFGSGGGNAIGGTSALHAARGISRMEGAGGSDFGRS